MANDVKITWHGHSCFTIDLGKKIVVDPFIEKNPLSKIKKDDVKADLVVVTHGHFDHASDAIFVAKNNNAPIVTVAELGRVLKTQDDSVEVKGFNIGGTVTMDGVTVTAVPAVHSSSTDINNYGGNPIGVIIMDTDREFRIYHAGDTSVFKDMELISELYKPQISILPIGGFFTMSPFEAMHAVKLLKSALVIPMHFNTFEAIKQDPNQFKATVEKETGSRVIIPTLEEDIMLQKKEL